MTRARLIFAAAIWLLTGCGALWIFVGGSIEESACEAKLPKGTPKPPGQPALKYACELDGGAHWELLGSDCTDVPSPPPHGSWKCVLDGGASWWEQE